MIIAVFILFLISGFMLFLHSFSSHALQQEEKPSLEDLNTRQRKLYHTLILHGYQVELFYTCGRYTIQMAVPKHRIAIECASKVVPFPSYEDKVHSKKDRYLTNRGWRVLRFSTSMIQHQSKEIIKRIENKIVDSKVP